MIRTVALRLPFGRYTLETAYAATQAQLPAAVASVIRRYASERGVSWHAVEWEMV